MILLQEMINKIAQEDLRRQGNDFNVPTAADETHQSNLKPRYNIWSVESDNEKTAKINREGMSGGTRWCH